MPEAWQEQTEQSFWMCWILQERFLSQTDWSAHADILLRLLQVLPAQ